jgi:hypothetical protein
MGGMGASLQRPNQCFGPKRRRIDSYYAVFLMQPMIVFIESVSYFLLESAM